MTEDWDDDHLVGTSDREDEDLRSLVPLIGDTPIVELTLTGPAGGGRMLLKLEGANPGGSLKDRPALHMIDELGRQGRIGPGATLIDSTSGNFGVSMAWLARAHECRFVAITDPNVTPANLLRMRSLGAEVEVVSRQAPGAGGYWHVRVARARERALATPGAVWINQYENGANPRASERWLAPEILRQLPEAPDAVVAAASTGGTLAGLMSYLRAHSPRTLVVAVDGPGSSLFGGAPGPRLINGLGSTHPSPFLAAGDPDLVVRVSNVAALACCWELWRRCRLPVGGSGGAAIAACAELLRRRPGATVLCICPDHGSGYRSTIFDSAWLAEHDIAVTDAPVACAAARVVAQGRRSPAGQSSRQ